MNIPYHSEICSVPQEEVALYVKVFYKSGLVTNPGEVHASRGGCVAEFTIVVARAWHMKLHVWDSSRQLLGKVKPEQINSFLARHEG